MTEYQFKKLLDMKTRILEKVEGKEMKACEGAELLGMTRQGFLKFRKQYRRYGEKALLGLKRGPKTWHRPWNRTSQELEEQVIRFREENPMDGPITISWEMADEQGVFLHHQTIYRILKRAGLIEEQSHEKREWQYVITNFPGERVQIDTCFPWGRNGPCVMEAVDVYSRWAYGQLFDRATMENAAKFVKMFVKRAPFEIFCFQPDNGSEFKSLFQEAVESLGMTFEPIPPYSPNCNGRVERLHKTTKYRLYYRLQYDLPLEEKNYQAEIYFHYYNWERRHQGIGMNLKTPMMKIQEYVLSNLCSNGNLTVIQYRMAGQESVSVRELLFKVTNLNNYAAYHLLTEENIFARYNYPDSAEHIAAHNVYREKMKQVVAEVEKEGVDTKKSAIKIAEFAGGWLMNHILAMDQKYAGFMRENGIE